MPLDSQPFQHLSHASFHGVSNAEVQQCVDGFVDSVRDLMVRYIDINRSNSVSQRAEAAEIMNVVLDRLRDEVLDAVETAMIDVK